MKALPVRRSGRRGARRPGRASRPGLTRCLVGLIGDLMRCGCGPGRSRAGVTACGSPGTKPGDLSSLDVQKPPRANAIRSMPEDVSLELMRATVWPRGPRGHDLGRLNSPEQRDSLRNAARRGHPIWLQVGVPKASEEQTTQWLEGSIDVWDRRNDRVIQPTIRWERLEPILKSVKLPLPRPPSPGKEPSKALLRALPLIGGLGVFGARRGRAESLLGILPELYGRGLYRAGKDAFRSGRAPGMLLFSTVGFVGVDDEVRENARGAEAPCFWAVRMNVCVIRNIVITVRLEDLLCDGRRAKEHFESRLEEPLWLPDRFLPARGPRTGREIAEAIGLHQASSARHASERLREWLKPIEAEPEKRDRTRVRRGGGSIDSQRGGGEEPRRPPSDGELIRRMQSTTDQLDRQLSRLLRRFGPYGGPGEPEDEQLVPPEVNRRYGYALDEIRSVSADARLAADAVEAWHRERVEFALGLFGAAVLAPTLIVGLFGANVDFPWDSDWKIRLDFSILLAVTVVAGIATFLLIRALVRPGLRGRSSSS